MTVKALKPLPPEPLPEPKQEQVYRVSSVKLPNISTLFHDAFSGQKVFPTFPDAQGSWHEFLCDADGGIIGAVPAYAADKIYHPPINLYEQWCREAHEILKTYGLDKQLVLADLNKIFNRKENSK